MFCSSILFPILLATGCLPQTTTAPTPVYRVQAAYSSVSASPRAIQTAERLSDPRLAEIRGGRGLGLDRLTTEVRVREMTLLPMVAAEQMDAWWATAGSTMISENLGR